MSVEATRDLAVAVFARAPVPGTAKTRLIPKLGARGAAQLQAQLTERALARARAAAPAVSLWWTGTEAAPLPHDVPVFVQHGADLGARMALAFDTLLPRYARVLLIGTDCPAQTPNDLRAAAHALDNADGVVQPAEDGGYVLIGLAQRAAPGWRGLFENIAWGTSEVLEQTLARAAAAKLALQQLPPRPDLDTPTDYDRALAAGWITPIDDVTST